jgi:chromosome segregation ATPase
VNFRVPRVADNSSEEGFESAAARLDRAFARLEASVRSLNGRMRTHARIESDTQKLVAERARYASELDKANAHLKRLDDSAEDVSRRLVAAMEEVRSVLSR